MSLRVIVPRFCAYDLNGTRLVVKDSETRPRSSATRARNSVMTSSEAQYAVEAVKKFIAFTTNMLTP